MVTVNDAIQIAPQTQTPATAAPGGAGGFFGASATGANTLFANLLLQQMSASAAPSSNPLDPSAGGLATGIFGSDGSGLSALNLDGRNFANADAENLGLQDLGFQKFGGQNLSLQSLLSSGRLGSLLPLLNALKSQLGSKGSTTGKYEQNLAASVDDQKAVPDAVLAAWLSALSAQQSQPDLKNLKIDPSNTSPLPLGGAAGVDARVLKAIEQMISRLEQPGPNGQSDGNPPLSAPEKVVPASQIQAAPAELKAKAVPVANEDKNSFAALAQAAGGDPRAEKPAPGADTKTDSKPESIFNIKPVGNDPHQTVLPPAPQDHAPDANSQSQTSSQPQTDSKGSSNGDSRKGNASADQFQSVISNMPAAGSAHPDQANAAAIIQPVHGNTGNGSAVSATADKDSSSSVRDLANTSHLDPTTPRVVNEAHLMQAAGQAEMHVSIKSETAGSVDVRAMLEGNHISATIAAQHSSTRDWLTANLGELQSALSRDDLHLRAIEVTDSSLQNDPRNSGSGQQDAQQQQQFMRPQIQREFQQAAGLTDDLDLNQNETATQALSLLA
jgi:flagellar hook-length control protein FliK